MATIVVSFPESGLSGTISVINMATEVEDFSGAISEIGTTKTYKFEFVEVADTDYSFVVSVTGYDAISGAIFRDTAGGSGGGLTVEEHDKLMNMIGGGFSGGDFTANDRKILNETHDKVITINYPDYTEKLNEIDSHIELAKETVIDTIEEVETEVCSDIIRKTTELKKDNIATRNLVRQKTKKLDENTQKLADRQDLTDKLIEDQAEEIEEELELIYEQEVDMIEKEINTQFEKEADDIESNLS